MTYNPATSRALSVRRGRQSFPFTFLAAMPRPVAAQSPRYETLYSFKGSPACPASFYVIAGCGCCTASRARMATAPSPRQVWSSVRLRCSTAPPPLVGLPEGHRIRRRLLTGDPMCGDTFPGGANFSSRLIAHPHHRRWAASRAARAAAGCVKSESLRHPHGKTRRAGRAPSDADPGEYDRTPDLTWDCRRASGNTPQGHRCNG